MITRLAGTNGSTGLRDNNAVWSAQPCLTSALSTSWNEMRIICRGAQEPQQGTPNLGSGDPPRRKPTPPQESPQEPKPRVPERDPTSGASPGGNPLLPKSPLRNPNLRDGNPPQRRESHRVCKPNSNRHSHPASHHTVAISMPQWSHHHPELAPDNQCVGVMVQEPEFDQIIS